MGIGGSGHHITLLMKLQNYLGHNIYHKPLISQDNVLEMICKIEPRLQKIFVPIMCFIDIDGEEVQ